jgi:hypothetical protein
MSTNQIPLGFPKESDTDYPYYTDSEGCGYIFHREPGGGSIIFAEVRGVGDYNIEFNMQEADHYHIGQ